MVEAVLGGVGVVSVAGGGAGAGAGPGRPVTSSALLRRAVTGRGWADHHGALDAVTGLGRGHHEHFSGLGRVSEAQLPVHLPGPLDGVVQLVCGRH